MAEKSTALERQGVPHELAGRIASFELERQAPAMAELAPSATVPRTDVASEMASDVTPEEQAAFEATVMDAPAMVTVTAEVEQSSDELRDLFNGNDW